MGYIWSLIFPRQPPLLVDGNFLAWAGRISWRDCNHFEGIEIYIFSRSAISIKSTFSRSSSTLSLASTSSQRLSPIDSIIKHMRLSVWLMCLRILTVLNLAASLQYNYFVGKDLWGHCSLDGTLNGDGSRLLKGKFFSLYSIFSITALFAFWSFPSFLNFRIYSPGTGTLLQLTLWRVK